MTPEYLELNPGENIILVARKHIVNVLPVFIGSILVILIDLYGMGWITAHQDSISKILPAPILTTLLMIINVVAVLIAVLAFIVYFQNKIVLTDQHFIQVNQNGLFGRSLSKFSLDELQDVKGSRHGFFATILNYGELQIQTAAERDNFVFRPVSNPLHVAEVINDTHEAFERAHTFERP